MGTRLQYFFWHINQKHEGFQFLNNLCTYSNAPDLQARTPQSMCIKSFIIYEVIMCIQYIRLLHSYRNNSTHIWTGRHIHNRDQGYRRRVRPNYLSYFVGTYISLRMFNSSSRILIACEFAGRAPCHLFIPISI